MRDHKQLRVFGLADDLVETIYRETDGFPRREQFGLTSQIRRAAVSIAANIVEGCTRSTQSDYLRFLEIAYGSARELEYEIDLAVRLGFIDADRGASVTQKCVSTSKSLCALIVALRARKAS